MTKLSIAFFGESVYLGFLEFAREGLPGFTVFSYDWRGDVRQAGEKLCATLAAMPAAKVALVGHSMGGLVALDCLRRGAPKVRSIVFAGTPFAGAAAIFQDLVRGDHAGRNRSLLSAEALFTFPLAWQLLPPASDFLAPAGIDAFTTSFWIGRGLGVFRDPELRADPAYRVQLERMIEAHRALWSELRGFSPGVAALAIVGVGHDTVSLVRAADGSFDFDHPALADGDGLVTSASARPFFPHQELETRASHSEMLSDPEVQRAIARFVRPWLTSP